MSRRIAVFWAGAALAVSLAAAASAAELSIGAGSALDLGTTNVDLGCADIHVAGTLLGNAGGLDQVRNLSTVVGGVFNGGSGAYFVTGGWSNRGQFLPGTSSVNFVDGCAQTLSFVEGNTTFFDFEAQSVSGKTLEFEAGSVTTVTGDLVLAGVPGTRLAIRSSVAGVEAFLDIQGTQFAADLEVQDNHAIGQPLLMGPGSVGLGNTNGWWATYAIPALGGTALVALAGSLLYTSRRMLRPPIRGGS